MIRRDPEKGSNPDDLTFYAATMRHGSPKPWQNCTCFMQSSKVAGPSPTAEVSMQNSPEYPFVVSKYEVLKSSSSSGPMPPLCMWSSQNVNEIDSN